MRSVLLAFRRQAALLWRRRFERARARARACACARARVLCAGAHTRAVLQTQDLPRESTLAGIEQ